MLRDKTDEYDERRGFNVRVKLPDTSTFYIQLWILAEIFDESATETGLLAELPE